MRSHPAVAEPSSSNPRSSVGHFQKSQDKIHCCVETDLVETDLAGHVTLPRAMDDGSPPMPPDKLRAVNLRAKGERNGSKPQCLLRPGPLGSMLPP